MAMDANRVYKSARAAKWVTRVSLPIAILGLIALARMVPAAQSIHAVVTWIEHLGIVAPFAFVGVYLAVTVLMLPAWPLSVAAGAIFGLALGMVAVVSGATLGMAATFLIGRYLARPAVERRFRQYPRFAAIDRAVGEGGWKIVALLRLSPAVPFNVQNYLYGLTAIRFWPCIIASAIAILPGAFMYVYLGYAGRAGIDAAGAQGRSPGQWALLVAGLFATIAVTVYVTRLARRAVREQSHAEPLIDTAADHRDDQDAPTANPWKGAAISATAAVLVVFALGGAQFAPGLLVKLFGPPAVSMEEAYTESEDGPRFDHAPFDALLAKHVNRSGGVDYAGLRADSAALHAYTASLADAPFGEMGRNEKLALLLNAYNACTLQLIVEWRDKNIQSIRDIPSDKRWADARWNIGGSIWSLEQIEHEQIRPKFREPDVHWALVCAAVGCPPLRPEAYATGRVVEQLRDQARIVHTDGSRWFQLDMGTNTIHLTPLYKWYGGDFTQISGSVLAHAAKCSPALAKQLDTANPPRIEWLNYDWDLNSHENVK